MKKITKRFFVILVALLCASLCLMLVGCGDDTNEGENDENGTAADTAAATETSTDTTAPDTDAPNDENNGEDDSDGENNKGNGRGDEPTVIKQTAVVLNNRVQNVRMLNSRDTATHNEMTCDFIGSGIAFRLNNAGGDVTLNVLLSENRSGTFLVKVDGAPFAMNGSPYIVVTQSGKISISDIPTGEHDIEIVKVSGYTQGHVTLYKLAFYGTLVAQDHDAEKIKIEVIDENALYVGITDRAGVAGTDAMLSYAALLDGYEADISLLDFGNAGLLGNTNTVLARYSLRSPNRGTDAYDFASSADLVIVNIGAVDYAASHTPADNANAFGQKYLSLLNLIRTKNGIGCRVLCLYPEGVGYGEQILAACNSLGDGVYAMEIPDDYLADGVLTAVEMESQKQEFQTMIDEILEDINTVSSMTFEQSGIGITLKYRDFFHS